jgi:glycosyltransferase involved in cell wall biosynthesis/SAM-dependent methyltransferase
MTAASRLQDRLQFVFYVPGMPFDGGTLERGRSLGGSESAGYYLAREVARRGHAVTVYTAMPRAEEGEWDGVAYRALGERTPETPLGAAFESHAVGTPCDVLIGQRLPGLFHRPTQAKVNLWWAHDLALKRHAPSFNRQVWNLNGVLCVSEFHRAQLGKVYGLRPEAIHVVPNGVDRELFRSTAGVQEKQARRVLVYSSRPERGLEHLLGGGDGELGIMERLLRTDPAIQLQVCTYDNVAPELAGYYAWLGERCRALPNVNWLGALSKRELAALLGSAWLHVYPTTFEEVSCIAAMEAQCAGTPSVTTPVAALPETLNGAGARWVALDGAGRVDRPAFAQAILALQGDPAAWLALHEAARTAAPRYEWRHAADAVECIVEDVLRRQTAQPRRLARHLLRHGDVSAVRALFQSRPGLDEVQSGLAAHDGFALEGEEGALAGHAETAAAREQEHGLAYDLSEEAVLDMPRFQPVLEQVAALPSGSAVLHYGCGLGRLTAALARRFPRLRFVGASLYARQITQGRAWLAPNPPPNLALHPLAAPPEERFDLVFAAEVLEHALDPGAAADRLEGWAKPGGTVLITVPSGPWEEESLLKRPRRRRQHHLEHADLLELWGEKPGFRLTHLPLRLNARGEALGYHVALWRAGGAAPSGRVRISRKLRVQRPAELLSVCMIVRPDGDTLARTLKSVRDVSEQIVIGIDGVAPVPGTDAARERRAWAIAREFGAQAFAIPSPLRTGFDAARNATLDRAKGDWVLWIDDDEELLWPERLVKYLRDNPYDAYAVAQHHFAVEPGGVIKTDYPCRLFRTGRGFRFYGVVHEHPELGLNQGPGRCLLLPDVAICHNGYMTEEVRRRRFQRNLPLMLRDRERYKERTLGKFLWIRDLAHLNRFEYERTRAVSPRMLTQAREAIALWRELLAQGQVRLAVDALPYYSECAGLVTPAPFACDLALAVRRLGMGDPDAPPPVLHGQFAEPQDAERLAQALLKEKLEGLEGRWI